MRVAAGIAAITAAVGSGTSRRTAPAPAAVGAAVHAGEARTYRAVVFLNTGVASRLSDAQRANFEAY